MRPSTSTMPTAMVNTMLASTQRGRYCSGPVRNKSTTSDDGGEGELRDLAARARLIRHRRLGRAAVDDEGPADRRGGVGGREPRMSAFSSTRSLMLVRVDARRRRALGDDHDEA